MVTEAKIGGVIRQQAKELVKHGGEEKRRKGSYRIERIWERTGDTHWQSLLCFETTCKRESNAKHTHQADFAPRHGVKPVCQGGREDDLNKGEWGQEKKNGRSRGATDIRQKKRYSVRRK